MVLLSLFLLSVTPLTSALPESTGDISCKETRTSENSSKVTAHCQVDPGIITLPCARNWTFLILEVTSTIDSIRNLSLSLFSQCSHISDLAIWDSGPVTSIQRDLFQPLYNLHRLFIRATNLRWVDRNLLLFLPRLTSLSITDSKVLKHLGKNTLEPLPSQLTTMDLSNNELVDPLQPELFGSRALRYLYMQSNRITQLHEESFTGMPELRLIRLSDNRLSGSLEFSLGLNGPQSTSALISVPKLEILDLAGNYITEITGCRWSGGCDDEQPVLTHLRVLNLAKNRLLWLDPKAFKGLPALIELELSGNNDLFRAGSLPVVLFALKRSSHPELKHLSVPTEPSNTGETLELCQENTTTAASRILMAAMEYLNKEFCESVETTLLPVAESTENSTELIPEVNEGPIFSFIRTSSRWVMSCIAIGLLLTGVLISALIFACIHFGLKTPTTSDKGTQLEPDIVRLPSRISLQNIYAPEAFRPSFTPVLRTAQSRGRLQVVAPTGFPGVMPNQALEGRRNASNSIYSLLSAPANHNSAVVASTMDLISVAQTPQNSHRIKRK